jgi:hypothetical protein
MPAWVASVAEHAGHAMAEQRARDHQVDVEIARDLGGQRARPDRQLAVQRGEQRRQPRLELVALDLCHEAVVCGKHGVEDAVERDVDRQLRPIDVVIRPRVARLRESRRGHHPVALQPAPLVVIEAEPAGDRRQPRELAAVIPGRRRTDTRGPRRGQDRRLGAREIGIGHAARVLARLAAVRAPPPQLEPAGPGSAGVAQTAAAGVLAVGGVPGAAGAPDPAGAAVPADRGGPAGTAGSEAGEVPHPIEITVARQLESNAGRM